MSRAMKFLALLFAIIPTLAWSIEVKTVRTITQLPDQPPGPAIIPYKWIDYTHFALEERPSRHIN